MSGASNVIFDTSVLLEFFQGSNSGIVVRTYLMDNSAEKFMPSVVLCELASKIKRAGMDPVQVLSVLEKNMVVLDLDKEIAKDAGFLRAELKKKEPGISMIDCVIMVHATMKDAMIITKDRHFKHYEKTHILD